KSLPGCHVNSPTPLISTRHKGGFPRRRSFRESNRALTGPIPYGSYFRWRRAGTAGQQQAHTSRPPAEAAKESAMFEVVDQMITQIIGIVRSSVDKSGLAT